MVAVETLRPLFKGAGHEIPKVRVTCGWPSHAALSKKRRAIGECWDKSQTQDDVAQIFISPLLEEVNGEQGVLEVLVHELVHAVVGCKAQHRGPFSRLAGAVGLVKPWTSTLATPELQERFKIISDELGPYPHAPIIPSLKDRKPQGSRLIKAECDECGYTVRVTKKWLDIGPPHCPLHGKMSVEDIDDDEGGDDE